MRQLTRDSQLLLLPDINVGIATYTRTYTDSPLSDTLTAEGPLSDTLTAEGPIQKLAGSR